MNRFIAMAAIGLAVLTLGTGCSNNKAKQEKETLLNDNKRLSDEIAAQKQRAADAEARAAAAAAGATAPTDVTPVPTDATDPTSTGGSVSTGSPDVKRGHNAIGEDTLTVSSDVLFDSGKATLKPAAKKALDKAASIISKEYSGRQIRVEGYTDPTPVKTAGWDDNWDLGAARARSVMLYLQTKGVRNMYIASFGATNLKSSKNLALDRRVEIVVVRGAK